ncbi:MAG: hypothetical protein AAF557_10775 [Pseudomonadota bacterium]
MVFQGSSFAKQVILDFGVWKAIRLTPKLSVLPIVEWQDWLRNSKTKEKVMRNRPVRGTSGPGASGRVTLRRTAPGAGRPAQAHPKMSGRIGCNSIALSIKTALMGSARNSIDLKD